MNLRSPNRSGAQTLRERLREATNEAILGAAEKVFSEQGMRAAKMEAIAAEAGVAVGTLYNHFKDRDGLLVELVTARRAEMMGRLDEALRTTAHDKFPVQLQAFVAALCAHLEAHKEFLTIWMECDASRDGGSNIFNISKRRDTRPMEEIYRRIETLIQRGLKSHALRAEDAEIYPVMLMGMLKGSMVRRLFHTATQPAPLTARVEQMTRFFLHGAGV